MIIFFNDIKYIININNRIIIYIKDNNFIIIYLNINSLIYLINVFIFIKRFLSL
jgi:hypothetical protein